MASESRESDLLEAARLVLSRLPTDEQLALIDDDDCSGMHRWADAHLRFDEIRALRRAIASEEKRRAQEQAEAAQRNCDRCGGFGLIPDYATEDGLTTCPSCNGGRPKEP